MNQPFEFKEEIDQLLLMTKGELMSLPKVVLIIRRRIVHTDLDMLSII